LAPAVTARATGAPVIIPAVSTQLTDESIENGEKSVNERVAVAGSGAIACGLAAVAAARLGGATLIARSPESAERARAQTDKLLSRMEAGHASVTVHDTCEAVADATIVIEAIAESFEHKAALLADLHRHAGRQAILGTTTSSLSVQELGAASGRPERFVGLHVFNPVPRMDLVEVAYTTSAMDVVRSRVKELVDALGKTYVEVPDTAGFVVNRLLFPMLFDAVRLLVESDGALGPAEIDQCMKLGAGHPMGPLALLDFVGLDVAIAIGDQIGANVPERLRTMAKDGALGKKAGRGFFDYS
jgi:3-hydroxybutyryl-CoA dehydrogenase